jgi:hypothetical protein
MALKRRVCWAAAAAALGLLLIVPMRDARKAAVESGQRSLLSQAERQLEAYHASHGAYPASLEGLKFHLGDGADATTLNRIEYRTDGKYYRLETKSEWDGSAISVCR